MQPPICHCGRVMRRGTFVGEWDCPRELPCDGCGLHEHLSEHADADLCDDCARAARIEALAARVDARMTPPAPVMPTIRRSAVRLHGVAA